MVPLLLYCTYTFANSVTGHVYAAPKGIGCIIIAIWFFAQIIQFLANIDVVIVLRIEI